MVEPRPASTVVLLRDSASGLEVYFMRRHSRMEFTPGAHVFPGGSVDASDYEPGHDPLHAHLNAAVREVREETGVELAAGDLRYWSRWVTPEASPKRFDARFYVTPMPIEQEPSDVSGEADWAGWLGLRDALDLADRSEIVLIRPTYVTVRELAGYDDVESVLAAAVTREPLEML